MNTESIDTSYVAVKKTGWAFLIVGCLFGAILLLISSHENGWSGWDLQAGLQSMAWRWFAAAGLTIYLASVFAYPVMRPFHTVWMMVAFALGWLSSHLLLTVYFFLVITPTGLVLKLTGKDLLKESPDPSAESYWIKRRGKTFDRKDYERLF